VELILPFRLALLAIVLGPAIVCAQTFEVPRVEVGGHAGWIGAVGECLCALPIVGPRLTINLSQQNAVEVHVETLTPASPATYGFYFVQYKHTARRSSGQAAIRPFYTAGTGGYYNHRRIPEGRETRPDGSVVIYPAHSTGEVSRLNIATFGGGIERDLSRCRFSEGRDPSFSKPFPPDLSSRLSARHTPSGCPNRSGSVYTFASCRGRWRTCRRSAAVGGGARVTWACRRGPRRDRGELSRLIATAPSLPWRAAV
jgi:hypothetical protein